MASARCVRRAPGSVARRSVFQSSTRIAAGHTRLQMATRSQERDGRIEKDRPFERKSGTASLWRDACTSAIPPFLYEDLPIATDACHKMTASGKLKASRRIDVRAMRGVGNYSSFFTRAPSIGAKYNTAIEAMRVVIDPKRPPVAVLDFVTCHLRSSFPHYSWVGVYRLEGDVLKLSAGKGE